MQVYRTFLVWEGQVGIIAVPVLILLADIGTSRRSGYVWRSTERQVAW